uniref:VG15 protein n=1 Tax=Mycolicibacterium palauense TaxID=2034511 RepID=UPI00114550E0|nr:hypothetical protein [Mycolicibacterium palauense]
MASVFIEDVRFASVGSADPLPIIVPDVESPGRVPAVRFATTHIPSAPSDGMQPVELDPFPEADASTSLAIQGNSNIKAQMPGKESDLMYSGLANSAGAGIRHAMNGGRNAMGRTAERDERLIGWARVTDGNPCYFCALLASRGAVYRKYSFNQGGRRKWNGTLTKADRDFKANPEARELPKGYTNVAKVHDNCRCQLRPVYSNAQTWDAEALYYRDMWDDISRKHYWKSNDKIIQEFRKAYEPYTAERASVQSARIDLEQRLNALEEQGFTPFSPQVEWTRGQLDALAT